MGRKVVIAAAGTGGHLLPAQALARELIQEGVEVRFVGKGLSNNRCFAKELYPYAEIESASPFARGKRISWTLPFLRGVRQSFSLWNEFSPDLIIGFGSYYTLPPLLAALWKRTPIYLFDSNAIPGRVTRLFAPFACESGLQFRSASRRLRGKWNEIEVPFEQEWHKKASSQGEAKSHFGLSPEAFTILLFGGSGGASCIDRAFIEALDLLCPNLSFQVIHITGDKERASEVERIYREKGIKAYISSFEKEMFLVWQAADLLVSRAGASTIAEQIGMGVPGVLIPFARAADDHQRHNALFLSDQVGGGECLLEKELSGASLAEKILVLAEPDRRKQNKKALEAYRDSGQKASLRDRVLHHLQGS